MTTPPTLSAISDPTALGKLQILLVPVHPSDSSPCGPVLTDAVCKHWTSLIKHHTSIRSDEIPAPSSSSSGSSHVRGGPSYGPRARFFPSSSATSVSRANTNQHVHLAYPAHPPARHLYPLSLLRLTAFPLVVIGISVSESDGGQDGKNSSSHLRGYSVDSEEGDIGEASTPRAAHFQINTARADPLKALDDTLSEMLPPSSPFPLVKRVVVVPPHVPVHGASSQMSPRKASGRPGGNGKDTRREVQHAPAEGAEVWIAGLVGEVVGELLEELGELATALETPTGLKTLSSTLLPSLTSNLPNASMHDFLPVRPSSSSSDHSRSNSTTPTGVHGASLDALNGSAPPPSGNGGMGISLKRSLTPGGRPTSVVGPIVSPIDTNVAAPVARVTSSSNPFRRSTVLSSPFTRTSSAASITSNSSAGGAQSPIVAQRYTQANLGGIAGGRLMKVLGDFYLLIGQYGDAIKCYDDGAERCRVAGDPLWEGVAREGRAVAAIGEAWEARDGSDRVQSFSSSPIPVEILAHYLSALSCISKAPLPYPPTILSPSPQAVSGSLTLPAASAPGTVQLGTGEGLLAYLYTSLCLKIAHFQLIIWAAGGWGSIALSCLMGHTLPRTFPLPLDLPGASLSSGQRNDAIEKRASYDAHAHRRRRRFLALLSARAGLTRSSIYTNAEAALGPHHRGMTKPEQLAVHVELIWLARYLDLPRHEAVVSREAARKVAGMVAEGREETRRLAKMGANGAGVGMGQKGQQTRAADGVDASVGLGLGMAVAGAKAGEGARHGQAGVVVQRKESTDGNIAIVQLLERALTILGVDLLPPFPVPPTTASTVRQADDLDIESSASRKNTFGWPELRVDALQSAISVVEAMADHHNVARLCLSALKSLTGYLNPHSQAHLAKLAPAALGVLKRRGIWDSQRSGGVGWWVPGRLVLSLEVSSLPPNRLPVEHSTSEIQASGTKDPFLYNPRIKPAQAGKTILVANEQVDVFVTLSNPFAFDLEMADLGTAGATFLANPLPVRLPASSVQTIRITGTCPASGILSIQGVRVRLPDGARTEILMPMVDAKAKERREKRKSRLLSEVGKMKSSGLEARMSRLDFAGLTGEEEGSKRSSVQSGYGNGSAAGTPGSLYKLEEGEKWLECQVVPEQPLLWVKKSSLTHGTVMLYDGERTTVRLTLENSSSTPVNFVKLSFDDNTVREANAVLAEEITPRHAYEIQHDQLHRPVMRWDAEQRMEIKPGARASIAVECFGKIGCTDGTIRIDYGYVRDRNDLANGEMANSNRKESSFHTRSITFPILFTVYDTLEPHDLEILPFPPRNLPAAGPSSLSSDRYLNEQSASSQTKTGRGDRALKLSIHDDQNSLSRIPSTPRSASFAQSAAKQDMLRQALTEEADDKHCLVALSVRNVFGVPFEVCLARTVPQEGSGMEHEEVLATRLVPPGATERLIIPLPRLSLSASHLAQPIPTLGTRQYVVDKTGRTASEIQQERELFWYRQSLLSMLRLTYIEPSTKREGEIGLRRVTLEHVDRGSIAALKVDEIDIEMWFEGDMRQGEFGTVCCKVVNRLETPIVPNIRIEAVSSHSDTSDPSTRTNNQMRNKMANQASKHVIFDGVLSRDLPALQPGAEGRHEVGIMFLAAGQYGFRAILEYSVASDEGEAGNARSTPHFAKGAVRSKASNVLRVTIE